MAELAQAVESPKGDQSPTLEQDQKQPAIEDEKQLDQSPDVDKSKETPEEA